MAGIVGFMRPIMESGYNKRGHARCKTKGGRVKNGSKI